MIDLLIFIIGIDNEIRLRYDNLKQELQLTTQHQLILSNICRLANMTKTVYSPVKVEQFLNSIDLSPHNHIQRARNIRSRLIHVHNLYVKLINVLSEDELYN